MKQELINRLMAITKEEKEYLSGKKDIDKEVYTSNENFTITSSKLLEKGQYINIRNHARFVDFPVHSHNYIELMYVCQGTITHYIDGKEIYMRQGDMLFLNQYVEHGIKKAGEKDIGLNFIVLPQFFDIPLSMLKKDNLLADFLINILRKDTRTPQYLHFKPRESLAIENLMENIVDSILRGEQDEDNINQITMGVVFLHLLNYVDTIDKESSQSYQDILMNTTLNYINTSYQNANLTELSNDMHQSLSWLSKFIKKNTGYTFKQLLQRKKFQKAVELLVETNLSVADIMSVVGYENSSYFYRKFEEKYMVSPKEYRKSHKNDNQIYL